MFNKITKFVKRTWNMKWVCNNDESNNMKLQIS